MNCEKNLKIKTKGLTSLLRSMNYNTSVVVIKTAYGYKTTIMALRNDGNFMQITICLNYRGSVVDTVYIRMNNTKKDLKYEDLIHFKANNSYTERKDLSETIANLIINTNRKVDMFYTFSLKNIKTALLDPVLIKQYLSVQKQMNRITNTINEVKI
jgi:hypothetical protein